MSDLVRYSLLTKKMPREFILLQGTGCIWKRCTFCDYYLDVTEDPFTVNRPVIEMVTGELGVLDIINSGSAMELDEKTLSFLRQTIERLPIHTVWFEAHWLYHRKLKAFAEKFPGVTVKFRTGVETFDPKLRKEWGKGIPEEIRAQTIADYFSGICLLIGIKGQTKQSILRDIKLALEYFEYFSVNAFVENTTDMKRDQELVDWFVQTVFPDLKDHPNVDILINNTDLGVGAKNLN